MSDTSPETDEVIRYLSPPEYVKEANARDHRVKHSVDLHHFAEYLRVKAGLLIGVSEAKLDGLIADYLQEVEP